MWLGTSISQSASVNLRRCGFDPLAGFIKGYFIDECGAVWYVHWEHSGLIEA
jgi:hypothetical protein